MNLPQTLAAFDLCCQQDHKARATQKTYRYWILAYVRFLQNNPMDEKSSREKVSAFLSEQSKKSAATQKQALNALAYLYKRVMGQSLGKLPDWVRAKAPRKLPRVLTPDECVALLREMQGTPRLIASVLFGSGLRLTECLELRTKDICLQTRTITVRQGKGDKSRSTFLPQSLVEPIREQIDRNRTLWRSDRERGIDGVELPGTLARKFPRGGESFEWFYLWPARSLCKKAPRPIRWHLHEGTVGKALNRAASRAQLGKTVSAHVLRHSFATAALSNGINIHELQTLLGHTRIETTSIYLHTLPQFITSHQSPLDIATRPAAPAAPAEIIPFPGSLRAAC